MTKNDFKSEMYVANYAINQSLVLSLMCIFIWRVAWVRR